MFGSIALAQPTPIIMSKQTISSPVVLAKGLADIDGDGQPDSVAIVLISGSRYTEDGEACCQCGDKYEGQAVVSMSIHSKEIRQDLGKLFQGSPVTFEPGQWELVLTDYNHDGQIDFNLAQPSGCHTWDYALFTIDRFGKITKLPVAEGFPYIGYDFPSTKKIQVTPEGFTVGWIRSNADPEWRTLLPLG